MLSLQNTDFALILESQNLRVAGVNWWISPGLQGQGTDNPKDQPEAASGHVAARLTERKKLPSNVFTQRSKPMIWRSVMSGCHGNVQFEICYALHNEQEGKERGPSAEDSIRLSFWEIIKFRRKGSVP